MTPAPRPPRTPDLRQRRPRRMTWLYRYLLVSGTFAMVYAAHVSAAAHGGPQFREPGSGHRVNGYTIELVTDTGDAGSYQIPTDCERLLVQIDAETRYPPTRMLRQAWHKVETDCRFYLLLRGHPASPVQDYISTYDFMNASLDDLPITAVEPATGRSYRRPQPERRSSTVEHLPVALPIDRAGDQPVHDCRLRDGLLRGNVFIESSGKVRCRKGDGRPTLRLISVNHSDVDGDQVMDAVLRFVFMRPGMPRAPVILPLTRDAIDAPIRPIVLQAR